MRSILIYVAPDEGNLPMVQAAADLVEAISFDPESPNGAASVRIGLVAEPSACLEVGLSMLGRGQARTVEGGERSASPLMLFPFVTKEGRDRGELNLLRREWAAEDMEEETFGSLSDLLNLGAVEAGTEVSWEHHARVEPNEAVEDAVMHAREQQNWDQLVVFSSDAAVPDTLNGWPGVQVIRAGEFSANDERFYFILAQLGEEQDESLGQQRREAVAAAMGFEKVLRACLDD